VSGEPYEALVAPVPGPSSKTLAALLQRYESRNVTAFSDDFPVFWESAAGATVVDADGNRYLDLTAAFGVAAVGHANARVAAAIARQAARLMHGMGDVHPTGVRARLLERLAHVLPRGLSKTFLTSTGSEAVEAAMKTALLATGRTRFACYRNAYHGLSFGALAVCGMEKFRAPFAGALAPPPVVLEYPSETGAVDASLEGARRALRDAGVAALLIEPVQGRGGCVFPPPGYLTGVRSICDELGIVMIADEIYTGFGRTGDWFAVQSEGIVPDVICIGKAMGGGFPIGAAVGTPAIMDAWPPTAGEALHTSTYLGNPMGCAAALATIDELESRGLPARAKSLEPVVRERLQSLLAYRGVTAIRGRGLLWGVQTPDSAVAERIVKGALARGLLVLASGALGDVVALSPPLVIGEDQLARALDLLEAAVAAAE
jgi:4-aminobutyrate aminotransferase-like enzyme